ncbi:MAG: hypothetical protein H7222_15510 [Methylotenera sp.]|nr:hypothetical protein [Oligoflexia bacterium]
MNLFYSFLSGAILMGCWVAGVFFLRFWRKTNDRLFLWFCSAFWILAVERLVLIVMHDQKREEHSFVYLIRLVAFLLILLGVYDKNRVEREVHSD